jgi:hypothetical protein
MAETGMRCEVRIVMFGKSLGMWGLDVVLPVDSRAWVHQETSLIQTSFRSESIRRTELNRI